MKRISNILLWCAALLLTALTLCAQTSIITGTVRAPDGTPWQTSIEFLSKSTPVGIGTVTVPTKRLVTTATNGTFSVALFPGTYQTTIRGASGTTGWPDSVFYIFVSTNLGTYDITSVMTNKLVALYPSGLLTTKGDIYVYDGTNVNRLAAGASNQVLRVNPTTVTGLEYVDLASATVTGAVTSVGVTSAVTALTVTGSPITSSGNIGLSLHSNLVDWSAIPTNTLTGLGTGSGSVTNVTLAAPTGGGVLLNGAAGTNTITSGGTNSLVADWSAVASVTNVATSIQAVSNNVIANIASSNYVTASITNGLAGTNQLYEAPLVTLTPDAATNFVVNFATPYCLITATNAVNLVHSTNREASKVKNCVIFIDPTAARGLTWLSTWKTNSNVSLPSTVSNLTIVSFTTYGAKETNVLMTLGLYK